MNKPLITFAITSYKNYKYIKEALNSVFIQDYPNIQLIISNDGSPDFNEEELISYLNKYRTENITQLIINNNERNLGTVKNVEYCRSQAQGEFIMYMAADDALYDNHVLSRYIGEFERLGKNAMIVSSKVAMCSNNLSEIIEYAPDEEGINAIRNFDSQQMFSRLSHTFTIPTTSSCYRVKLYDIVGPYDEDYYIIEDAPLYAKMARMGIRFHWIDDMIGARHRDGGISHGNTNRLNEAYRKYRYDEIIFYKKEILPFKDLLLPKDLDKMYDKWNYIENVYFDTFIYPNMSKKEKTRYAMQHFPKLLRAILRRTKRKIIEISFDDCFIKELRNATIFSGIIYLLLAFNVFAPILQSAEKFFTNIFGWATIVTACLAFLMYLMRIFYRCYLAAKFSITGR